MTTYAVQAMLELAVQPAGKATSLKSIALRHGLKVKYLEQIFIRLNHAGLVRSKKGPGGGYYLDRPVDAIRIADIMAAVGESSAPVRCLTAQTDKHCSRAADCTLRPYWKKMKDTIDRFLGSSTLYDIMQGKNRT